jgi:hypothetical protein
LITYSISETFTQATKIISFFHRSPLQHAFLREQQKKSYGEHRSLLSSVITRWGSQYTMLHSIHRSQEALRVWADEDESGDRKAIAGVVLDPTFRFRLEDLLVILEPLHKAQKMSEAQKSSILWVLQRWEDLRIEIRKRAKRTHYEKVIGDFLDKPFQQRLARQLSPLHFTAYYLLPERREKALTASERIQVQDTITKYCGKEAVVTFFEFRARENGFNDNDLWANLDSPYLFWLKAVSSAPVACPDYYTACLVCNCKLNFDVSPLNRALLRHDSPISPLDCIILQRIQFPASAPFMLGIYSIQSFGAS